MRRPLKPFVTEYKGSTRRQKEAAEADQTFNTEATPARTNGGRHDPDFDGKPGDVKGRSSEPRPRSTTPQRTDVARFNTASSEDSYEAALRAADALFSPAPSAPRPGPYAPRPKPQDDDTAAFIAPAPDTGETAVVPPSGSGRILRSLEEPRPPSFADREEALPKRRGRKPGSKNKPKVPAPDEGTGREVAGAFFEAPVSVRISLPPAQSSAAQFLPVHSSSASPLPSRATARFNVAASSHRPHAAPSGAGAERAVSVARLSAVRQQGQRFSWVRTTLSPGQRWKRRLPKVIW